jgi:hypothetical protein
LLFARKKYLHLLNTPKPSSDEIPLFALVIAIHAIRLKEISLIGFV